MGLCPTSVKTSRVNPKVARPVHRSTSLYDVPDFALDADYPPAARTGRHVYMMCSARWRRLCAARRPQQSLVARPLCQASARAQSQGAALGSTLILNRVMCMS